VADDSEADPPGSTQSAEPEDGTPGVERLLTLSDGVVAIALTLLVLQLAVPTIEGVSGAQARSPGYLWKQLSSARGDQFTAYVVSFYVIAQFWLTHHRVFRSIQGHVEGLAWWNFAFLFAITLMPFSSDLLGRFSENPLAIDLFALNILLASLATQGVVYFARRHGLQSGEEDPKALRSTHFRVLWIYTVIVVTAALAWIAPRWAMIGWLLLVSAPRVGEIMARRFPGPLRSPAGLA
jgi:uncharacterized membrane protein